jgi:hypothetical protein
MFRGNTKHFRVLLSWSESTCLLVSNFEQTDEVGKLVMGHDTTLFINYLQT